METVEHHLYEDAVITSGGENTLRVELFVTCSCGGFEATQSHWALDETTRRRFMAHARVTQFDLMEA